MNNMGDITSWVGIVVFFAGLYCFYACYQMKFQKIINENIMLNKEARMRKCKDKEGYMKEMFPSLLIFSITTTLCGAIDMINTFVVEILVVYIVSLVLFVIGFLNFMIKSKKCRDKYY